MKMTVSQLEREFDRQVVNLVQKNYHLEANMSQEEFLSTLNPLRDLLRNISVDTPDLEKGYLPFVIVIKNTLLPIEKMMGYIEHEGKRGVTKLFPLDPEDFEVVNDISVPDSDAYLLVDVDRGQENRNIPPNDAMMIIKRENRMPLTIEEGIALITHFPNYIIKNNCFYLLALRTGRDQRVPAIWINAKKEPNLGWCWNGNPHTWLGSASCRQRLSI